MPHWQALEEGRTHLGYQVWKGAEQGRWLLRRYVGKRRYRVETPGLADDTNDAFISSHADCFLAPLRRQAAFD
jgi:hypothetical protein